MKIFILLFCYFLYNIAIADAIKGIALPTISKELKEQAKQAKHSLDDARINAINIQKPNVTKSTTKLVNNSVKTAQIKKSTQTSHIKNLLSKTINNKSWQQNQSTLIDKMSNVLDTENQKNTLNGDRMYFFISSSMPLSKVRHYVSALEQYPQAQIIMRGFIGGAKRMQPSISYIKKIISKDTSCDHADCKTIKVPVNIDPALFRRYKVNKVPTLVYINSISGANYCSEGNKELVQVNGVKKFVGTAPLKYMLQEIGAFND